MNTIKKISSKEILNLLDNREFFSIKNSLNEMNGVDIATLFSTIPTEQLLLLYRLLKKDLAAETFVGMSPETQKELIQGFSDQDLEILLTEIYADDLADILEELPAGVVSKIISKADPDMRKDINLLLNYPEDSAGAIMTTEFISMSRNTMVSDAFEWIRTHGDDRKDVYTCYITDENRKLQGITTVREMLLQKNNIQISEIMDTNVISVNTHDDREDAARIFDKYNLHVLPVTDSENRLVGIITSDDVIDVIQEEVTEDFEKMSAMVPSNDSYLNMSVLKQVRNRLPWLLILMFSSIFTGIIINHYEAAFETLPVLVALMPMLSDTGGNCGSQTSTLIIRGMALNEINIQDFLKVFWKEFRIGFLVGVVLAITNGVRVMIQYRNLKIAIIIAITLLLVTIVSKLMGAILPILAKTVNLDPALIASPILTTIVDICAVWIYFKIAFSILRL